MTPEEEVTREVTEDGREILVYHFDPICAASAPEGYTITVDVEEQKEMVRRALAVPRELL